MVTSSRLISRGAAVDEPTFTIFSDAKIPGWGNGFAKLLREGSAVDVDFADSLDGAIDGESDVLILNLGRRDDEKLTAEQVAFAGTAQGHRHGPRGRLALPATR